MGPEETSKKPPSEDTHSKGAADSPRKIPAIDEIHDFCRVFALRMTDAYEAYVATTPQKVPPESWWCQAALRCCLDMLHIEYHLDGDYLRRVSLAHLTQAASAGSIADFAEQIRSGQASGAGTVRLPDPVGPLSDEGIPAPYDLPRPGVALPVKVRRRAVRLPDPFFPADE